ncbi:polymeric immunoglobulin receptor-like [Onychostoma macrolepis]|uniref:polymeric immunoglobulin receptor-like n=1 Tax=Onychostoma macrolepis TaxID=369639 RepID=UPI00272C791A|nr:polymeric immunoglobulin receptor-like [Onychostoma macrolepis]
MSDEAGINALDIGVKSGSPGIIPCLYDKKHKENRKYWCEGSHWVSCSILRYTNETGKYSLTDYPAQSIFTVQWENLQTSDSGYYWCAVEIRGAPDDGYYLYLTVQSAPDVSVVSSSVSGREGDDISVQCLYSSQYKNKVKHWCKYKDQSCYTVRRTDTSQNPSVQISDDGRRSFTVLMTGLRLTDSGWYCCSVGDQQVPVQLTVTKPKRAFTTIPAAAPSDSETDIAMITDSKPETDIAETHPSPTAASETVNSEIHSCMDEQNKSDVFLVTCLITMFMLLLIVTLVAIVTWRLRKKPARGQIREGHFNSTRNTSSAAVDENSVIYSSVITFRKAPPSSLNSDSDVIYSSLKQTHKAVSSE